jgi:PAS domain S-box-containing protein
VVESDFQAFDAIGATVVVLDTDDRIIHWNQACSDLTGYLLEEARGRRLWDFLLVPAEIEPVKAVMVTLRTTGRPSRFANHWLTKIGERRWIVWSNTVATGPDGQPGYVITTGIDRTEGRHREDEERELLAELGAALADTLDYGETLTRIASLLVRDFADFCILDLIDRSGKLRRVKVLHRDPAKTMLCEAFERLPVDEQHAAVVSSVVESKHPRLMADVSSQYLESTARDDEHLRALRALAPRSLMVVPLLARGGLLGALVLVSSRASHRYGEHDLRLAEKIASRAALAIENAQLYEEAWNATDDLREVNEKMVSATIRAQELAEEAEAAKARLSDSERELREVAEFREMFIGIVGHDLRTPLAAIGLTAASLLRQSGLDEQAKKQVARIISSKDRMAKMISQLLDLTRARLGGGFLFEPKLTDLRQVFEGVVEEFEAPIQLEVEGDLTGIWDPDRLAEALSNIAGNAIEHAVPGTAVVVKAHAEGPEVVVEISNQGEPIPEDALPFIFEPFRRAEQHKKSASGNLGLGLYIAKQIVHSGSGTLVAYSTDGKTTFLMRLPRQLPTPDPPLSKARGHD